MVSACLPVYSLPYSLGIVWKIIPIHKESRKKEDLDYSRNKIISNENYWAVFQASEAGCINTCKKKLSQ